MARQPVTDLSAWPSLSLEGNLIAPAMVARIASPKDDEDTRSSYGVRKGLTIREEISMAFRVGQSHWDEFARRQYPSQAATQRFVRDFLAETFGFHDLVPADGIVSFVAGDRVPVVVAPPGEELERRSPTLSTGRSRSPAFALQDWLNDHDHALWGLVTNGASMRLLRDNASLTRPAHVEADLEGIFTNEDAASFAVFWLLMHRSRFGVAGAPATDCPLERWRDSGARLGEAARDRLAAQVQQVLKVLGSGFLRANHSLATQLKSGHLHLPDWFNELLRLVYRLIFLMVAEDRNLLHPTNSKLDARQLYDEGYSLTVLRRQCIRAATWDKHHDRYEGMKVVFRALARGEEGLALPALGGLFSADQLPHLETAHLPNKAFMEAIYRLGWFQGQSKTSLVRINWQAMETEELGSVYESLLELQPQLADDGRSLVFATEASERRGNQRKTTGSYYTPDSLVQALLDSALDPVLDQTEAEADDPAKALLQLSVIDPACGSGHFLLAAARRLATRLALIRADGAPGLADFRPALRDVVRCCIHGVDKNPMAVELARVALWIETVTPGLPLGFLDEQIRCGDSLLGLFDLNVLTDGIPDAAYKPLTGDDKATANHYKKANRTAKKGQIELDLSAGAAVVPAMKPLASAFSSVRNLKEDTLGQIKDKAASLQELRQNPDFTRIRGAADLYVAAFLLPKTGGAPATAANRTVPTTDELWQALAAQQTPAMMEARQAARRARAFHWPLEFPDVMERDGFDVVLGNPPWEVMQLSEQEFFATRKPDIAVLTGAKRKEAIEALHETDSATYAEFIDKKRHYKAMNEFGRECRFELTARGKPNTYSLFAELVANLSRARAGVIVPTGIATDASTAPFFTHLVEGNRLASLVDFENLDKLFPAVDSSRKFSLLTMAAGSPATQFAFFLTDPAQLADPERSFTLSPQQIIAINPNTRTAPVFRSRLDGELTARIYGNVSILIDERKGTQGNPWGIGFRQGLFNMTSDSNHFRTAAELYDEGYVRDGNGYVLVENAPLPHLPTANGAPPAPGTQRAHRYLPLYEAKMIHQLDHRWASFTDSDKTEDATPAQKANPRWEPIPRHWVTVEEVTARLDAQGWSRPWLIGWRKITKARNKRTVIAAVIPLTAVGDSMPLMLPHCSQDTKRIALLLANLSCLAYDFCARQKIGGTNMNFFIYKQLPVLPPSAYDEAAINFILPRILELTYTSHVLAPWAKDLGHSGPPFPWDEERRARLRAELDAFYAHAYGLSRDELRYILDPADVMGSDYPSETFRVLKEKDIKAHGEYRTRRLVLAAWDELEAGGGFADPGF